MNRVSFNGIRVAESGEHPADEFLFHEYHLNSDIVVRDSILQSRYGEKESAKRAYDERQAHIRELYDCLEPRRHYDNCELIPLRHNPCKTGLPLEQLVAKRRSLRNTVRHAISIDNLAFLLENSVGITASWTDPQKKLSYSFRAAPSGGALYPIETFIIPFTVNGLDFDVYHYDPFSHAIERLGKTLQPEQIREAFFDIATVANSSVVFILSAQFRRSSIKYGERAYRFVLLEAGAILEHVALAAEAIGLRAAMIGGYVDSCLNAIMGCNSIDETVIICGAVGKEGEG